MVAILAMETSSDSNLAFCLHTIQVWEQLMKRAKEGTPSADNPRSIQLSYLFVLSIFSGLVGQC